MSGGAHKWWIFKNNLNSQFSHTRSTWLNLVKLTWYDGSIQSLSHVEDVKQSLSDIVQFKFQATLQNWSHVCHGRSRKNSLLTKTIESSHKFSNRNFSITPKKVWFGQNGEGMK